MTNNKSVVHSAAGPAWRSGWFWLALTVCVLPSAGAFADDAAATNQRARTTTIEPVLEDQVLPVQRAAVANVGPTASANATAPAYPKATDGLAGVLGPATTAPGAPTFDYSALARDVGDQTRYGDPSNDADTSARASDAQDTDSRDDVHGTISVSVGTGGMRNTRASITLPVIADELTVRITGEQGRNTLNRYDSANFNDSPFLFDRRGGRGRNDYRYQNEDSSSVGLDVRWSPNGAATRDSRRRSSQPGTSGTP